MYIMFSSSFEPFYYFLNKDDFFFFFFRYNPENIHTLERYVELQARDNGYDLEANLALLKLYQFNPGTYQSNIACQILMKALTNLPHTDFVLCKCLLGQDQVSTLMFGCNLLL